MFTKSTYKHRARRDSKRHHQQSFAARVDLPIFCIQLLMLNPKKLVFEAGKTNEVENFAHFEKDVFFSKNNTFRVFHIFDRKEAFIEAKT
jgi:hypothetical protein